MSACVRMYLVTGRRSSYAPLPVKFDTNLILALNLFVCVQAGAPAAGSLADQKESALPPRRRTQHQLPATFFLLF